MTDWFHAFQGRPDGFVAMMERANTSDNLNEVFLLIVNQLFTRNNDEKIRKKYIAIADDALKNSKSLEAHFTKPRIVSTQVMNDRILRAEKHMIEQRAKDRRASDA